jgi:predicted O-methyltransferase YrrM
MKNTLTLQEMLDKTDKRKPGFELMIAHLRTCKYPLIVETGVSRQEDNYFGDGQSTLIWDAIANELTGTVHSVDIDPNSCKFVRNNCSEKVMIWCSDSIKWLATKEVEYGKLNRSIDLLYLDSYDIDIKNWHPSALHHIYELLSIKKALRPGTLVAVDDNLIIDGEHIGKGTYVAEFMKRVGKKQIYDGYQWVFEW